MKTEDDIIMLKLLGNRLNKLREEQNISLRALAILSGLDNSKLSKIENGEVDITLTTLFQICKGLDISPSLFMKGYPDKSSKHKKFKKIGERKT